MMKKYLLPICIIFITSFVKSQNLYFPPLLGNSWDTISPDSLGWCTDKIDPLFQYLKDGNSRAFILLKDGKIVIEKYFGSFTRDSLWYWASAGKTVTSFMVGIAQQENYLSISDTTSQYLGPGWTSCDPAQEEKITIRNQLTMTSGLNDGNPDNYCTLDTCLICIADAGMRWAYHNAPYTLLDDVLENATGLSLNTFIFQKLELPTGITGGFFPSGYNNVFVSKARSMARFGLLILNHGKWNGNQIMTDTSYFRQMVNTSQNLNLSYGYLWWLNGKPSFRLPTLQLVFPGSIVPHAPTDMIAALGKNGQIINVVPSQNLLFIRMGDAPGVGEIGITFNDTIWQKLNEVICNVSAVPDIHDDVHLNIFPNPVSKSFTIKWTGENFDFKIVDLEGRILFNQSGNLDSANVNIGSFPKGVYFVNIRSGAEIFFRKILRE